MKNYTEEEGSLGIEIVGTLTMLQWHQVPKLHLVTSAFDIRTIGELVASVGYKPKSVAGRKVLITIEDYKE